MVATVKSGRTSAQVAFTSALSNIVQAKEALLGMKNRLVACGWTVVFSCGLNNGAGRAADTNDNWVVATDLEFAIEGVNHSHVTLRAPATKGRPSGADRYYLIINCISAGTLIQVQPVSFYLARQAPIGGTATARQTSTTETAVLTVNIIPWTVPVAARYIYCDSDDGDLIFGVKPDGVDTMNVGIIIQDDLAQARGNYVLSMFGNAQSASSVFTSTNMTSTANWRNFQGDGSIPSTATQRPSASCTLWNLSATGGLNSLGEIPQRDIDLITTGNAAMRDLGRLVDIAGVGGNLPMNSVDDTDTTDPIRLRCGGPLANAGACMLPVLRSMGAWV